MGEKLRYTIKGTVKDQEAFTALVKRRVQSVEADEPDTLDYEWFTDGTTFLVHAIYRDSNAFLSHFERSQSSGFLEEFMECADMDEVLVLTTPSPAAKEVAEQFGATYLHGLGGVVR